jgi:FlaA1/EpsC-like NDP-sugar epimerase
MARGGEIFALDMGEPVRILDLAKIMINISGLQLRDADNPNGDIEIVFTGLRRGDKLFEEIRLGKHPKATEHPRIFQAARISLLSRRWRPQKRH